MAAKRAKMEEDPSVTVFREYLRIKTVQPNPDYGKCDSLLNQRICELKENCNLLDQDFKDQTHHSFEISRFLGGFTSLNPL